MKSDEPLRIAFIGDIALNGHYDALAGASGTYRLAESIETVIAGSDLSIGNLEGPLTTRKSVGPPSRFCLHGNPSYAAVLGAAGLKVVSLANNHAMDHGWEALEETFDHLKSAGIKHVGAGININEARRPLIIEFRGMKIAILAYCDVFDASALYANEDRPGVAPMHRNLVFDDIAKVKQNCDILILCMHWGQENISEPAPKYRRLAREIIDAGANIVVGHHPHVLQGTEIVNSGAVAYSLGNFTFSDQDWHGTNQRGESFSMPYRLNEANRWSAVWQVVVDVNGVITAEELIPVYLGTDLLPVADPRPVRQKHLNRINAALKMRAYSLVWSIRMIRSRVGVILRQVRSEQGFGKRLLKVRPRHIRQFVQLLAREWGQFRAGSKH